MEPNNSINFPEEVENFRMITSGATGNEKFIIKWKDNYHLTIHFGAKSKVFDIHLTREKPEKHVTLFKMRHFTFARMTVALKSYQKFAIYTYLLSDRINPGKLVHHRCILKKFVDPDSYEKLYTIKNKGKHSNSMRLVAGISADIFNSWFIEPHEIYNANCEFFEIYKPKKNGIKKPGLLYKMPLRNGKCRFYFISNRNWMLYNAVQEYVMFNAFKKANFERKQAVIHLFKKGLAQKYKNEKNILKQINTDLQEYRKKAGKAHKRKN